MKQTDIQNKFRKKFLNQGVKMTAPETVFFSNDTKIGKKAIVGASSVITQNVKSGSLALTRTKQTEVKNYKRKK